MNHDIALIGFQECVKVCVEVWSLHVEVFNIDIKSIYTLLLDNQPLIYYSTLLIFITVIHFNHIFLI